MINPRVIRRHEVSLGGFGRSAIVILEGTTLDSQLEPIPTWAVQNCGCDPAAAKSLAEAEAMFDRLVDAL